MISQIIIPDLGGTDEVTLDEWLAQPGDYVKAGTPLLQVTTAKATVEVEAFRDGYLQRILIPAGSTIELGSIVALIADAMDEKEEDNVSVGATSPPHHLTTPHTNAERLIASETQHRIQASPLARRLAREHGIDLAQITGSGPQGQRLQRDVQRTLSVQEHNKTSLYPLVAASATPDQTQHKLPALSPLSGSLVVEVTAARAILQHLQSHCEKQHQVAPALHDLAIYIAARVLKKIPELDVEEIHIGVANGLCNLSQMPILYHADRLNLRAVADATHEFDIQVGSGSTLNSAPQGHTFTILNCGPDGLACFQMALQPTDAPILTLGAIQQQSVLNQRQTEPRLFMAVSLSVGHHIANPAAMAQFLNNFKALMESPMDLIFLD